MLAFGLRMMCSSSADIFTDCEQLMLIGAIGLLLDCGADAQPTMLMTASTLSILFISPLLTIMSLLYSQTD